MTLKTVEALQTCEIQTSFPHSDKDGIASRQALTISYALNVNILAAPKKSYHPARKDNIERVQRDEAEAKRQQELQDQQSLHADAEARLELLRRHTGERAQEVSTSRLVGPPPKKRKRLDAGEAELEAQLGSKGWRVSKAAEDELAEASETSRAVIVRPEAPVTTVDSNGHINFWADLEQGVMASTQGGNEEYLAEKKKEQDKWEEQITMYLGRPAKELRPWYGERDLTNGEDRKKTEDQLLEAAYVAPSCLLCTQLLADTKTKSTNG